MNRPSLKIPILVVLFTITVPYLVAFAAGGEDFVFTGILKNAPDGASYLAKMEQGRAGAWRFNLPYTAELGEGKYLFLFYLALGHLARLFGLSSAIVFHIARVLGSVIFLFALRDFYGRIFPDDPEQYSLAYWLTIIGSGLGWLAMLFGLSTADTWVSEAYPFQSMFSNPHFPIGLALLLWIFVLLIDTCVKFRCILIAALGLLISVILPFGFVVAAVVAVAYSFVSRWVSHRTDWLPVLSLGLLGGPYLLYQYWVAQTDPILAGWNAQNLTYTPAIWDVILSFSPALWFSLAGVRTLWQKKHIPALRLLLVWFILSILLIYVPFSLQRRFMTGLYISIATLSVFGLLAIKNTIQRYRLRLVLFLTSTLTNIFFLLILLFGISSRSPLIYLSRDEAKAIAWINQAAPRDALVLASPEMGSFIPAFTARRVIYGHPYETLNAQVEQEQVESFFTSDALDTRFLTLRQVDYIFVGPREQSLGPDSKFALLPVLFESGNVKIFSVRP